MEPFDWDVDVSAMTKEEQEEFIVKGLAYIRLRLDQMEQRDCEWRLARFSEEMERALTEPVKVTDWPKRCR